MEQKIRIGDYLKSKRESLSLSLADMSERTKINLNVLKALEASDFAKLPSRTYVRGFIINYTKALGVETNTALQILEEHYEAQKPKVVVAPVEQAPIKDSTSLVNKEKILPLLAILLKRETYLGLAGIILLIVILNNISKIKNEIFRPESDDESVEATPTETSAPPPEQNLEPAVKPEDASLFESEKLKTIRETDPKELARLEEEAKKADEAKKLADKKAEEEKKIADKKAEEEKKLADKRSEEEKKAAEKKALEEKKAAEKKAAEEKKAEEKRLAEEKKAAEKKALEEKKAAEKKAAEEKKAEEKRLAEEKKAAEKKLADEKKEKERLEKEAKKVADLEKQNKANFPFIEFKQASGINYKLVPDAKDIKNPEILPPHIKNAMVGGRENVFINSYTGDTWLTYQVDDTPVKRYVLKQGRTLFLKGQRIVVFLGNSGTAKVFYNSQLVDNTGVRSLIFPPSAIPEYDVPLFPTAKDGKSYPAKDYKKVMAPKP